MLKSDLKCIPIQKMVFEKAYGKVPVNSFEPRNEPGEHRREDGILYVNSHPQSKEPHCERYHFCIP